MNANGLKGCIYSKGLKISEVAAKLGIDRSALWKKMTGVSDFTRGEVLKLSEILSLTNDEMMSIFFNPGVEETQNAKE